MSVTSYKSVVEAIQGLKNRGFTASFEFLDQAFRDVDSERTFTAHELTIVEHYRFEGASDPEDSRLCHRESRWHARDYRGRLWRLCQSRLRRVSQPCAPARRLVTPTAAESARQVRGNCPTEPPISCHPLPQSARKAQRFICRAEAYPMRLLLQQSMGRR